MLTVAAMMGAPLNVDAMRTCSIAVAAARAAGALVMDSQFNLAERALGLNDRRDGSFRLTLKRFAHLASVSVVSSHQSEDAATR
jgi:hypothetical protein